MSDNKPRRNRNRNRKPQDADAPALDPARAARFVWQSESDIIITKARFSRSYDPGDGGAVLVQDLAELEIHLAQTRPGVPLAEALAEALAAPDFAFAPAKLRSQLREAGLLPEEDAP